MLFLRHWQLAVISCHHALRCVGWVMLCAATSAWGQEFASPPVPNYSLAAAQEEIPPPHGQAITPIPEPLPEDGLLLGSTFGHAAGCAECGCGGCVPGREACCPCTAETRLGRFCCMVYESICCPDPCYDPSWLAVADAAFFVPSARPQSQQRLRWDAGIDLVLPDRNEFFWARADGSGLGPRPVAPALAERRVDYHELSHYTETAHGNFAFFIELPYRSFDAEVVPDAAGFSDMNLGTKTLLFDRELVQIAFQFRTFIPQGNALKGLGTGHVSLEPSLILGLNLAPRTYFQGQVAEWIPLGGDPSYSGALLHYHTSLNHVLWQPPADVQLIGTLEFNGWSFQTGSYTDPTLGPFQPSSNHTYLSFGSGLRLVVCDKLDLGFATAFAPGSQHFAKQLYRTEFRWRY